MIQRLALVVCVAGAVVAYGQTPAAQQSGAADAIVVGAGLSGLSAAVEMGRAGVNVLVVDMNSVAGGHAVLAGGIAIVGTPLQEQNGIKDSPDSAYRKWTVDADPQWTRFYVENSKEMIYDWVTAMGVEFVRVGGGQSNSVPRIHFTRGRSIHLVIADVPDGAGTGECLVSVERPRRTARRDERPCRGDRHPASAHGHR